eukprot:356704-Chlamydomonas_euryale.AAC.16
MDYQLLSYHMCASNPSNTRHLRRHTPGRQSPTIFVVYGEVFMQQSQSALADCCQLYLRHVKGNSGTYASLAHSTNSLSQARCGSNVNKGSAIYGTRFIISALRRGRTQQFYAGCMNVQDVGDCT